MNKYTKQNLEEAVKQCFTWADVSRYFNVSVKGGGHTRLKQLVKKYSIDYTHFTGRASTYSQKEKRVSALEYIKNNKHVSSHKLRLKLISDGLKEEKCEICGLDSWMGDKIPLDLDHIDGNHENNALINLRILCKNCHGQTPTFGAKKLKKQRVCLKCNTDVTGRSKYCVSCRLNNPAVYMKK